MGVSENRGCPLGGSLKGGSILFWGISKRGAPILGNTNMVDLVE